MFPISENLHFTIMTIPIFSSQSSGLLMALTSLGAIFVICYFIRKLMNEYRAISYPVWFTEWFPIMPCFSIGISDHFCYEVRNKRFGSFGVKKFARFFTYLSWWDPKSVLRPCIWGPEFDFCTRMHMKLYSNQKYSFRLGWRVHTSLGPRVYQRGISHWVLHPWEGYRTSKQTI